MKYKLWEMDWSRTNFKKSKVEFFCIFQGLIHEVKHLIATGSLKNLQSNTAVTVYVLYNIFLYTQLASAFVAQKDFYYIYDNTDAFFHFLL